MQGYWLGQNEANLKRKSEFPSRKLMTMSDKIIASILLITLVLFGTSIFSVYKAYAQDEGFTGEGGDGGAAIDTSPNDEGGSVGSAGNQGGDSGAATTVVPPNGSPAPASSSSST